MELCNSMHLVDKILGIVPYFRCIEGCLLFWDQEVPGFKSRRPDKKGQF